MGTSPRKWPAKQGVASHALKALVNQNDGRLARVRRNAPSSFTKQENHMDRPSSDEKGKAQSNITEHVRQQAWTEAFENRSADAFAQAFAHDVVLEASILTRPVEGI